MAIQKIEKNTHYLARVFRNLPSKAGSFLLLDVGCSGGVEPYWENLGLETYCVGFDPLNEEVEKLNGVGNSNHRYVSAFVTSGIPKDDTEAGSRSNSSFHLTSASFVAEQMRDSGTSYAQEFFNSNQIPSFSEVEISLDEFLANENLMADFIKIDTDGGDFDVLVGADTALSDFRLLGLQVESQFHGAATPNANTFANIDQLLRQKGFSLFDLETWNYTRATLPGHFVYDIPAQTTTGGIQWGDALYFRDAATNPEFAKWLKVNPEALDKLLRLLVVHGLPDVAIGTLIAVFGESVTVEDEFRSFINSLVPKNPWGVSTYQEYLSEFRKNPSQMYPKSIESRGGTPPVKTSILKRFLAGVANRKL